MTLRAQWLGQSLRALRDSTGMTLAQAGEFLQRNAATVSRFESGEYPIRRPDLMALLDLYGVAERRQRDGLLRLDRQAVLHRAAPPRVTAIIDEFVPRRAVGGPDVLADQLAHLLTCAELPHLDLRVLPASTGAHASPRGGFLVFSIAEPDMDVGYAETVGGAVYVEPPDSERFVQVYDRLLTSALEPAESAELIRAIGEDSDDPHGPDPRPGRLGPGQPGGPAAIAPAPMGTASRPGPYPTLPAGSRCGTATTPTASPSSSASPPGRRSSATSRTMSSRLAENSARSRSSPVRHGRHRRVRHVAVGRAG